MVLRSTCRPRTLTVGTVAEPHQLVAFGRVVHESDLISGTGMYSRRVHKRSRAGEYASRDGLRPLPIRRQPQSALAPVGVGLQLAIGVYPHDTFVRHMTRTCQQRWEYDTENGTLHCCRVPRSVSCDDIQTCGDAGCLT